jgi:hypothetical protein
MFSDLQQGGLVRVLALGLSSSGSVLGTGHTLGGYCWEGHLHRSELCLPSENYVSPMSPQGYHGGHLEC